MRELPILFSTEMVRAILDGRKTMTRRVVKVDKPDEWEAENNCRDSEYGANIPCYIRRKVSTEERGIYYPHYDVGDKLYVRETWKCVKYDSTDGDLSYGVEFKDGTRKYFEFDDNERFHQFGKFAFKDGWQSSMFMPKEAARIWLEVTDVRVERLQEITEKDAIKEGVRVGIGGMPYFSCQDAFPALWDSTIKNQDLPLYGWDSNCWVWIYEFKRLEVRP
jgi:hypothetical protein